MSFLYLLLGSGLAALSTAVWLTWNNGSDTAFFAIILTVAGTYAVYFSARSLAFKMYRPVGVTLTRTDAPILWAEIDAICARVGKPRVHQVMLVSELTAALVQHPRRVPLLLGYRNYLLVGLPIMLGLTPAQFRSVLAHELAHLSRGHGRIGAWIYRLNLIWQRVIEQTKGRERHPFARFVRWYAPRLRRPKLCVAPRAGIRGRPHRGIDRPGRPVGRCPHHQLRPRRAARRDLEVDLASRRLGTASAATGVRCPARALGAAPGRDDVPHQAGPVARPAHE
ncbi:MAG: M48 family metallopeptidase [Tepidisphaeraceae bacterium]